MSTTVVRRKNLKTEEKCHPGCKGWDHFGDPFEIQRCDACNVFSSDTDAMLAHDVECPGCEWPSWDIHDNIFAWAVDLERDAPTFGSKLLDEVKAFRELVDDREGFLQNLPAVLASAVDLKKSIEAEKSQGRNTAEACFSGILNALKELVERLADGTLSPAQFGDANDMIRQPDGTYRYKPTRSA